MEVQVTNDGVMSTEADEESLIFEDSQGAVEIKNSGIIKI